MRSRLFGGKDYLRIQERVREIINASPVFLSRQTARSPRAVGDAIENIIAESFEAILGKYCGEYSSDFARRAMADIAFQDKDGLYYVVDVKTHRADTTFNMPNLISVERLARFYEDDSNYFVVLLVSYTLNDTMVVASDVKFVPVEFLDWSCLTIGALGWGQIQIANSNTVTINSKNTRKRWMLEFCDIMLDFYPKEILKIGKRSTRFEEIRAFWQDKPE